MSVTLILTSLPSESMLYQVLCVMDQKEVTGVVLVYDGYYHVALDMIEEKGLPFYRLVVGEDKPSYMAINEAVSLSKTPYVFFFDPCLTVDKLSIKDVLSQLKSKDYFAVGSREGGISFRTGLAVWGEKGEETWLSFESALVCRDRFLALGGFDSAYQQVGDAADIALSCMARSGGYQWCCSEHIQLERLMDNFWLQGYSEADQDQLRVAQSFLLFWQVGPSFVSWLGCVHFFQLIRVCLFFQPRLLRGLARALYWRLFK